MIFRRVFYHTKALLKKRSTWVLICSFVLLFAVIKGMTFPDPDNTRIGFILNDSEYAEKIADDMKKTSDVYSIVLYEDKDEMSKEIVNGNLECGFVFDDSFDESFERGKLNNTVEYVSSPYTTKGMAVRESFSAAFMRQYSFDIIKGSYTKVFGRTDKETKEEILNYIKEKNAYYIDSNEIFEVDFEGDFSDNSTSK